MSDETLFAQVLAPKNRADPYPLYARMRETPVSRQADGSYLVSTQAALRSLIFDPRLSSEDLPPSRRPATGNPKDWILNPIRHRVVNAHRPLIFRDPPDHDTLRGIVMKEFTIARVRDSHAKVATLVDALIDKCRGRDTVCLVDDLSCPLPVAVICELLGVPEADERQFHAWATRMATALEPDARHDEAGRREIAATFDAISDYMRRLIREKRRHPADDMLSGLAARGGRGRLAMGDIDLISTAILLLVAGDETTVNLISNGMLTLLRHPDELEKLKADPKRAPCVIEEILRHEPRPFPHPQGARRHRGGGRDDPGRILGGPDARGRKPRSGAVHAAGPVRSRPERQPAFRVRRRPPLLRRRAAGACRSRDRPGHPVPTPRRAAAPRRSTALPGRRFPARSEEPRHRHRGDRLTLRARKWSGNLLGATRHRLSKARVNSPCRTSLSSHAHRTRD